MMKLTWVQLKPYVIQSILFVIVGLLGWLGYDFLSRGIIEKQNHLQEGAVLTEYRQHQMNRLPELRSQYDFITEHEKELDIILPKERIVEFIQTLESIAVELGVDVEITSKENTLLESKMTPNKKTENEKKPDEEEAGPPAAKRVAEKKSGILAELPLPNPLRLTVTVIGRYESIVNYLHKMETLPIALDVIGVQLREHEEEAGNRITAENIVPSGNPFAESGLSVIVAPPEPVPTDFRLEADFDMVLYLKNL